MTRLTAFQKALKKLSADQRAELFQDLTDDQIVAHLWDWERQARKAQLPPADGDWRIWLMMAGRGFGKTRSGAEWIRKRAEENAGDRLALVAATYHEGLAVMIEGESGLLRIAPPHNRPRWDGSRRRLAWKNGTRAFLYSAEEPDALRGPQHGAAWCDELAKWPNIDATWMNLHMGLRLGDAPKVMVTTTPRPLPLLKALLADKNCVVTRGATLDNRVHLPPAFLAAVYDTWGKSPLGRQELEGELVEDVAGALWTRAMLAGCYLRTAPELTRLVVAIDPAVTSGDDADACGIIVAGTCADQHAYVLADKTVRGASPETWARIACQAAHSFGADRIVAEANNGGDLVRHVLHSVDSTLPVKLVRASRGKSARAEPVAALYERHKVHHVGRFPELEDELCGLLPGGDYRGPGKSPDRADALVWAISELALSPAAKPGMRMI